MIKETLKRYAVITKVEIYAGEEIIGTVKMSNGIGYKAKLDDSFISSDDICFVGKVLDHLEANDVLEIEEEI